MAPSSSGNRVVYQHPGISEWYTNGPLGLEQGFTLARPPAAHGAGPLTLAVELSGDAHASLAAAGAIQLNAPGGTVLRYDGLSASDASGRGLPARLALEGGRLLIRLDARHARYPVRVDPFLQQGEKLTGSGESGTGRIRTRAWRCPRTGTRR